MAEPAALGRTDIKGKSEPVEAFELLSAIPARDRLSQRGGLSRPLRPARAACGSRARL